MRFIIFVLLIMLLAFAGGLYLPWWEIGIAAFIPGLIISLRGWAAFIAGFTGMFLLWGGLAFWISAANDNILAHRVSLLILKMDSPLLLIIATGLIGGLTGGFASMAGSFLREAMFIEKKKELANRMN